VSRPLALVCTVVMSLAMSAAAQQSPLPRNVSMSALATDEKTTLPGAAGGAEAEPAVVSVVTPRAAGISQRCAAGQATAQECRFHWRRALKQTFLYLSLQDTGLVLTDPEVRQETFTGNWFSKYHDSLVASRFNHWNDGDPFLVNNVGHPMQGAVVGFIYLQNDPRAQTLELSKDGAYWKSRLRAMAWAAAYEVQWELGPIGEAGLGFEGRQWYVSATTGGWTNGAGWTDLVMSPTGGFVWMVGEDALDKVLLSKLERKSRNPLYLLAISALNPNRSVANLMRFRMPWRRDTRAVESSFDHRSTAQ
jgi:hypothetical protein